MIGYSSIRAHAYGAIQGISEGLLEYFLGKIPGLDETSGFSFKNMFKEALEEGLEEVVGYGISAVASHEEIDITEMGQEALEAFIMGGLIYGELGAPGFVASRGAKYINVIYNGVKIELNLSKIRKEAQARAITCGAVAQEHVNEAISNTENHKIQTVDGKEVDGIDQAALDTLFGPRSYAITPEVREKYAKLIEKNEQKFIDYFVNEKKYTSKNAIELYNAFLKDFKNNDLHNINVFAKINLENIFKNDISEADMQIFKEGITVNKNNSADAIARREAIIDYFVNKKHYFENREEVEKAFADIDSKTGGICSLAAFTNNIIRILPEKVFNKHFDYDKYYVDSSGSYKVNEILLADMVFQLGKAKKSPLFVLSDGFYKRSENNTGLSISNRVQVNWFDVNPNFLNIWGLEAKEIDSRSNYINYFRGKTEETNYVVHSPEELLPAIYEAYKNNLGIMMSMHGGYLNTLDGKFKQSYYTEANGRTHGHAVMPVVDMGIFDNIKSVNEYIGYVMKLGKIYVSSYGNTMYLNTEDVTIYDEPKKDKTTERLPSIGYTTFEIVEKNNSTKE